MDATSAPAPEPDAPALPAEGPPRRRLLLLYWLPLALYVGLIFALSSLSRFPFALPPVRHLDKLIHAAEYAALAFLLTRALWAERPRARPWLLLAGAVLLVAALGLADELYQRSVPNRDSDALDLAADCAGGLVGATLYLAVRRVFTRARS
ncbi:MAG TPA: VanZ family protein [Myxococcota bacterium]|nr:VanZ family protein [Myxococcota bacterium]HRY94005.1 VanZ family protein [Myxococcota bacterium]HSA24641.1 VanZ family protein [Myxococcota bacterium]